LARAAGAVKGRDDCGRGAEAADRADGQPDERSAALATLESALGYVFVDRARLEAALHHASWTHEQPADAGAESNERLEFLGDAVIGLAVAEALYAAQPDWREGDLTRALHSMVEGGSLAEWASSLGLGTLLRLGRTEESSGGRSKPSILEDAMEAVIGSIYLDGGFEPVKQVVAKRFGAVIEGDLVPVARDPKTALQEALMAEVGTFPAYRLVGDSGVEGDETRFEMAVLSEGVELARGIGRTKRSAGKAAAEAALERRDREEEQA